MLSQVYKARRALMGRLYPTTVVFKDGSTATIRYSEPRQIIKFPLTQADCQTDKEKVAWQLRRIAVKPASLESEQEEVTFNARKYLRMRKK